MGTHGFLHREGGQEYVKYILRQCTLPSFDPPSKVAPTFTNEQLRDMCSDILLLLTTSVTEADKVSKYQPFFILLLNAIVIERVSSSLILF